MRSATVADQPYGFRQPYRKDTAINARIDAARKEADRRIDQTPAAIEDYHSGVGKEVLLGQPEIAASPGGLRSCLAGRVRGGDGSHRGIQGQAGG
jgi:hypothetical protein